MQTELSGTNTEETTSEETVAESTSAPEGAPHSEGDANGDAGGSDTPDTSVEIDGKRFANEAEALRWALANKAELERDRLISEAYRTGIQDASALSPQTAHQQVAPPPPEDNWEEKYYSNPRGTLEEVRKSAKQEAIEEVERRMRAREVEREVWEEFCTLNPDLADFKTDVDYLVNSAEHNQIIRDLVRTRGQKEAMSYVAQKTRAKFQAYNERAKQTTVLPSGSRGPTPSGVQQKTVTQTTKMNKPVSFSDQLRQLKQKQYKK